MAAFDLGRLLTVLVRHEVEFMVVGGVAAVLRGAPVMTQDVDILYRIDESNITRLKEALDELEAIARGDDRRLPFGRSHLWTTGHKLAMTNAGPLDVLGSINEGLRFEDLLEYSDHLEVVGLDIRVLRLRRLVELKRALGRPKDLAVLPVLEATLAE